MDGSSIVGTVTREEDVLSNGHTPKGQGFYSAGVCGHFAYLITICIFIILFFTRHLSTPYPNQIDYVQVNKVYT